MKNFGIREKRPSRIPIMGAEILPREFIFQNEKISFSALRILLFRSTGKIKLVVPPGLIIEILRDLIFFH